MFYANIKATILKDLMVWSLSFGIALSCKTDIDDCKDGQCCYPHETNKFVRRIEGEDAGLVGSGFIFKESLGSSIYGPINSCLSCPVQADYLSALKLQNNMDNNFAYDNRGKLYLLDSARAYPYRVWGVLYELTEIPKLTSAPVYVFKLDKTEKVN